MSDDVDLYEESAESMLTRHTNFTLETMLEVRNLNSEISNLRKDLHCYNIRQENYGRKIEFSSYAMLLAVLIQILLVFDSVKEYFKDNWINIIPILVVGNVLFYKKFFGKQY